VLTVKEAQLASDKSNSQYLDTYLKLIEQGIQAATEKGEYQANFEFEANSNPVLESSLMQRIQNILLNQYGYHSSLGSSYMDETGEMRKTPQTKLLVNWYSIPRTIMPI
jgi:hypothetical protein